MKNRENVRQSNGDLVDSACLGPEPPQNAEEPAWRETDEMTENLEWLSPQDRLRLLRDLQAHQIELEMQNTELRRTKAELETSQARYFDLYDVAPVGYCTVDENSRIIEANLTIANLLGLAKGELVNRRLTSFIRPEDQDICYKQRKNLLEKNLPQACELRLVPRDNRQLWARLEATVADDALDPPRFRVVISDITDRKQAEEERQKLQEQLFHARKMEAVGTLAAGIAHDFNNILQGINGFAQLLLLEKTLKDPEYEFIMKILNAGERAAGLVRQLVLYSHKMEGAPRSIDVSREVRKTISRLQRTLPQIIDIELLLDSDLWPISADPIQIEQIVLNLSGNAADAMPGGGKLVISTENIILDNIYTQTHLDARPGKHALLTFADTGCGIQEETLVHIFDPFFTTKGLGKGLGLALVYGIVKSIGGHIACESKAGLGTTFKIYLPAIENAAEASLPDLNPK